MPIRVPLTISLAPDYADRLRQLAAAHHGGNLSAAIRHLIDTESGVTKSTATLPREATDRHLT